MPSNMSVIMLEIKALLVMEQLHIQIPHLPANRGKSFAMLFFIYDELTRNYKQKLKEAQKIAFNVQESDPVKIDEALQWIAELLRCVALSIPLTSLFFDDNTHSTIANVVSDIMQSKLYYHQGYIDTTLGIQSRIDEINLFKTGRCLNFASIAMHYLLEANIRPIDSLWLMAPSYRMNGAGHNILVIGLDDPLMFNRPHETDAIIFDFWNGVIFPARKMFASTSPLANFSGTNIERLYRIDSHTENPFTVRPAYPDISQKIATIASEIQAILSQRKRRGERVTSFALDSRIKQRSFDACGDIDDLDGHKRSSGICDAHRKLNFFRKSAVIIQKSLQINANESRAKKQSISAESSITSVDEAPDLVAFFRL